MSNSIKGFNQPFYRLRPQLKSLIGANFCDEILMQLNVADEPTTDIGTPRVRAMILPFRLSTQTRRCVSAVLTPSYRSRHHNCHTSTPSSHFTHPISCNTAQRKCLEIVQYRVKFSKSLISLSSRHGLRGDPERVDGDGSPGSRRVRPD